MNFFVDNTEHLIKPTTLILYTRLESGIRSRSAEFGLASLGMTAQIGSDS